MVEKDEKKNFKDHKGNKINQKIKSNFVEEYKQWRDNCESISGDALFMESDINLLEFLKNHFDPKLVRQPNPESGGEGSRNIPFADSEGVRLLFDQIEQAVDGKELFDELDAQIMVSLSDVLNKYKDTGKDAGGKGLAADPKFILFTEPVYDRNNKKIGEQQVQGHYRTEAYEKRTGKTPAPSEWLAGVGDGGNPPHQALYSETSGEFSKPRGLYYILRDAVADSGKDFQEFAENEVKINTLPSSVDAKDLEKVNPIEKYFDKVVRNEEFWRGGRLRTNIVARDFRNQVFQIRPADQNKVREIAQLGKLKDKDAILGKVSTIQFTGGTRLTLLPIITLVDNALKRKNTNKAPDGYRAWQNARKTGFDYRKTAKEAFGDKAGKNPNRKVISKMWQQYLWR